MRRTLGVLTLLLAGLLGVGCQPSCSRSDEGCTIASPCPGVRMGCASPNAPRVVRLGPGDDPIPGSLDARSPSRGPSC